MNPPTEEPARPHEASTLIRSQETFTLIEPQATRRETRFQKFKREFDVLALLNFLGVLLFIFAMFWVIAVEYKNSQLEKEIRDLQAQNLLLQKTKLECPQYFKNETGKNAEQEKAQDMEYLDRLMERKREFEDKKRLIEAQHPVEDINKSGPVEFLPMSNFIEEAETPEDEDYKDYEQEKIAEAVGNSTVHYDDEEEEDEEGVVELPTDKAIEIPKETHTA